MTAFLDGSISTKKTYFWDPVCLYLFISQVRMQGTYLYMCIDVCRDAGVSTHIDMCMVYNGVCACVRVCVCVCVCVCNYACHACVHAHMHACPWVYAVCVWTHIDVRAHAHITMIATIDYCYSTDVLKHTPWSSINWYHNPFFWEQNVTYLPISCIPKCNLSTHILYTKM